MKKFKITKEQLTYLHSVESIKETIEEWFPNEFPKLEVGKWYKTPKLGKAIFCVRSVSKYDFKAYGINYAGIWTNENEWIGSNLNVDERELATEQEVSEVLISEAKKRGFKDGVKIKNLFKGTIDKICNDIFQFRPEWVGNKNILFLNNYCIFKDGVWAEIISEPIDVTLEEIAKLKGCNVEQLRIKE